MTGRSAPWWLTSLLAVCGLAVAGYLTRVHFEEDVLVCGLGDCSLVQTSEYATIGSIPIAVLGLGMFASVLALSLARMWRPAWAEWSTLGILFICFTSLVYYGYLTYVEIWVLEAICQWCVLSSLVVLAIFTLELVGYLRTGTE